MCLNKKKHITLYVLYRLYSSVLVGTKDRATIDKTLWEAESSSEDPTKNPDFCKKYVQNL